LKRKRSTQLINCSADLQKTEAGRMLCGFRFFTEKIWIEIFMLLQKSPACNMDKNMIQYKQEGREDFVCLKKKNVTF